MVQWSSLPSSVTEMERLTSSAVDQTRCTNPLQLHDGKIELRMLGVKSMHHVRCIYQPGEHTPGIAHQPQPAYLHHDRQPMHNRKHQQRHSQTIQAPHQAVDKSREWLNHPYPESQIQNAAPMIGSSRQRSQTTACLYLSEEVVVGILRARAATGLVGVACLNLLEDNYPVVTSGQLIQA